MRGTSCAGALLLLCACSDLRVIPTDDQVEIPETPVSIRGLTMRSYAGAGLSQVVQAEQANIYLNAQSSDLVNLTMDFYENEEIVSTLQADYGVADLANEEFHADGRTQRIRITREDQNAVLYAETLNYEPADDRLFTDGPFVLVTTGEGVTQIVRGVGITTDPRLDRMEFSSPRITRSSDTGFDLEEFEREVRPITRGNET